MRTPRACAVLYTENRCLKYAIQTYLTTYKDVSQIYFHHNKIKITSLHHNMYTNVNYIISDREVGRYL